MFLYFGNFRCVLPFYQHTTAHKVSFPPSLVYNQSTLYSHQISISILYPSSSVSRGRVLKTLFFEFFIQRKKSQGVKSGDLVGHST